MAIPGTAFGQATFSEALAKSDILGISGLEASSTQTTSAEVPKPLDARLQQGERNAVNYRLRELSQQVLAYGVDSFPSDEGARRKV